MQNKFLKWGLIMLSGCLFLVIINWVIRGMPYLSKKAYLNYRMENFEESRKRYMSLYDHFLKLDTFIIGRGVLKVYALERKNEPWIFWCDTPGINSFFQGECDLKKDIGNRFDFGVIESMMKGLNLNAVLMFNRQILIVPRSSKYYFADEYILMKLQGDTIFDQSLNNLPSFKINDNTYIYLRE